MTGPASLLRSRPGRGDFFQAEPVRRALGLRRGLAPAGCTLFSPWLRMARPLLSCMDGARGARGKSGISAKGSGAAMYPAFKMQPLWPLALM
jgi:hypothetical protein